jgi:DNA modification methylase
MARPMRNNSKRGDTVYEPFSGSGTTIIAGETLGRRVFAVEVEPLYVDIAVARWEKFTGRKATKAAPEEKQDDRMTCERSAGIGVDAGRLVSEKESHCNV